MQYIYQGRSNSRLQMISFDPSLLKCNYIFSRPPKKCVYFYTSNKEYITLNRYLYKQSLTTSDVYYIL